MTDNVVKFKPQTDLNREDMQAMVEDLLQMIKDGTVSGVACVVVFEDDTVSVSAARTDKIHHLVAGAVYMQNSLINGFD